MQILPVVIDHEHARRKSIAQYVPGIRADAILALIVDELDPRVVLRLNKKQRVGNLTGAGEEGATDILEGFTQGVPWLAGLDVAIA